VTDDNDDSDDNLQSKYLFQTRENTLYVTSKFSFVVNGTQTLQGKLCARTHALVHITNYTYMLTYVITNKGQAIRFFTVIQEKQVWNVGWDTT
jgi:hypothetical protein